MRATRDLLHRRMPLARKRGARLAHVHTTNSQSNLPAIGTKSAYKANRAGVADRVAEPALHTSIAVDLARITSYDEWLRDVERSIVQTAKHHDANTLYLLHTVPGIGTRLSRVLLYDIHDIARFPRGQDVASSCRLITGARESAGQRSDTSGAPIGNAPLTWAFADAAVLCLRDTPAAQTCLSRLDHTHGKGQACTILAHTLARAVYNMGKRQTAFDLQQFLQAYGRGVGELHASLDSQGLNLLRNAQHLGKNGGVARP